MLHQELWQTENEEWIKERKKAWLKVKPHLEEINYASSKNLKGLRHFFIFGEVLEGFEFPRMTTLTGNEIPLFIKLWFIPELTKETINREVSQASRNDMICFSSDFLQETGTPNISFLSDGVMNGSEKIIVESIYEGSFIKLCLYSELHYSEDKYERYSANLFGSFNSSIYRWLQEGYPVNNAYQWMIPVWKDCIQYLPEKSYGRKNRFLRWLMEVLSPDYHQPHFDTDDRYQKVATELREYILSDESPEALKEVWREVHQG